MGLFDIAHFFLVPQEEPSVSGGDDSTWTYHCMECGNEVRVGSTNGLPPCLVCKSHSWVEAKLAAFGRTGVEAPGSTARMGEFSQPPSGLRENRIAHNEDLCRDLNERKAGWIERGHLAAGFRCECWDLGCTDRIKMSGKQWTEARSQGNRFAVTPGHVVTEFETVVKEYPQVWLIEKHGDAGEEAEASA